MSLGRLISRKHLTVLGLNSGTSADGLDMAVLRVADNRVPIRMLAGRTHAFPASLKALILRTADARQIPPEQIIHLDNCLGRFMGQMAARFAEHLRRSGVKIDLIGSHGQTVRHAPGTIRLCGFSVNGTLQLGSLDRIAAATGCVTIGDFRQADIALGGEGAPITTGAMARLFTRRDTSRLIVNIGGMANYFHFPARTAGLGQSARDCGPGNSLCDLLAGKLFGKTYDRGGQIAARGKVDDSMLKSLLEQRFFSSKRMSTGREAFGVVLAAHLIATGKRRRMAPEDIVATAAELTVRGIARAVAPLLRRDRNLTALHLMGGGRHNAHFRDRLAALLPGTEIRLVDELGIDGDLVEAAAYAVMAAACLRSQPLPWIGPRHTAARRRPIPGRIAQPPRRTNP